MGEEELDKNKNRVETQSSVVSRRLFLQALFLLPPASLAVRQNPRVDNESSGEYKDLVDRIQIVGAGQPLSLQSYNSSGGERERRFMVDIDKEKVVELIRIISDVYLGSEAWEKIADRLRTDGLTLRFGEDFAYPSIAMFDVPGDNNLSGVDIDGPTVLIGPRGAAIWAKQSVSGRMIEGVSYIAAIFPHELLHYVAWAYDPELFTNTINQLMREEENLRNLEKTINKVGDILPVPFALASGATTALLYRKWSGKKDLAITASIACLAGVAGMVMGAVASGDMSSAIHRKRQEFAYDTEHEFNHPPIFQHLDKMYDTDYLKIREISRSAFAVKEI